MTPAPAPPLSDKTTTVDLDALSSLCSSRYPARIFEGVLVRALQEHFSRAENLIYNGMMEEDKTQLQNYIWNADATKTAIQISPVLKYNAQDIQRRPAIFTKRNQWKNEKLTIGDGFGAHVPRDADGNVIKVGGNRYRRMVIGTHTIFCIGAESGIAETLGDETFEFLTCFAPIMRKEFNFHRLEVVSMEPTGVLDESKEHYVVPVVLAYQFAYSWSLEGVAPLLKTLGIDLQPQR